MVASSSSGHSRVRFHIQQESDIPASTQLYNQICFAIAARHYPPGHRLPSTRQLAMQTGLHRNTISKVYRQLENDGVVEAMAGSGIYVRDQQNPRDIKPAPGPRSRHLPDSFKFWQTFSLVILFAGHNE